MGVVTSGLLTLARTGMTIVSYFGKVMTASLFALTIVRKFTPRWSKTSRGHGLVRSLQTTDQNVNSVASHIACGRSVSPSLGDIHLLAAIILLWPLSWSCFSIDHSSTSRPCKLVNRQLVCLPPVGSFGICLFLSVQVTCLWTSFRLKEFIV